MQVVGSGPWSCFGDKYSKQRILWGSILGVYKQKQEDGMAETRWTKREARVERIVEVMWWVRGMADHIWAIGHSRTLSSVRWEALGSFEQGVTWRNLYFKWTTLATNSRIWGTRTEAVRPVGDLQ